MLHVTIAIRNANINPCCPKQDILGIHLRLQACMSSAAAVWLPTFSSLAHAHRLCSSCSNSTNRVTSGLWSYIHGGSFDATKTYWDDYSGNNHHLYSSVGGMPTLGSQTRGAKTIQYVYAPKLVGLQFLNMTWVQPNFTMFHVSRCASRVQVA